ncbi:response regulator transcription factor [Catenovulum sp. 2E275]|uniref:response regulator transcription factor n=1 Tax=Catenovulum sp. 2E275 TaxID=2980497 RepID=UPI0021CE90A4|nr:response regulator transcription factor [Catenovulum sp. 2E275]MCU4674925.1 response regulator transcription factor [Catenovulum sp. 2E275]
MRLLLVEDEITLNQQLTKALTAQGYAVDSSTDGEDGLFNALEIDYDIAVIDIGLPKIDGLELVSRIRQDKTFPILLLTARDHWQDKVAGLNAGADDYLAKPFQAEELFARLKALIRRSSGQSNPVLVFANLTIDTSLSLVYLDNEPVSLTAFEYKVLEYFVRNPNKLISKTELTEHLYQQDFDRDSNVIEVFVKRLRQKISPQQSDFFIQTIRGQGYRFNGQQ